MELFSQFKMLLWALLSFNAIPMAKACETPPFTEQALLTANDAKPIDKIKFHTSHLEHPLDSSTCIWAASWIVPERSDSIRIYVATYQKQTSAKIAEFTSTLSDLQLWFEPTIAISPTKFVISPEAKAFGVTVSWEFLAGTYQQNTSQLLVILPTVQKQLSPVLSVPIVQNHEYRNCPETCQDTAEGKSCVRECDGNDTSIEGSVIIGTYQRHGYFDIDVKSTHKELDATTRKPLKLYTRSSRYIWQKFHYVRG